MFKRFVQFSASLALMTLVTAPAHAWWETGHMLTAQMAYQNLTPKARAESDRLIQLLAVTQTDPARQHFVPTSVWMDEVKARRLRVFDHWHYINIPYNPDGVSAVENPPTTNIVSMTESLLETLKDERAQDYEKAFALRMLLHLVGDIHQPFHAVGKISEAHRAGDLGGNLTLVKDPRTKNLHALFDSTAGLFPDIKPDQWQSGIPDLAAQLQKDFPKDNWQLLLKTDPQGWAKESYKLSIKYGYSTLPEDGTLSPEFRRGVQRVCAERLALGGYRLAEILNQSFK